MTEILEEVDATIIGAGVIGLAIARALSSKLGNVLILEKQTQFGTGISSRNSEVIHAGLYYPQNSLKAQLCVKGKHLLYDYCAARHLPFARCGKLIVATQAQEIERLDAIAEQARLNGVEDLQRWNPARLAHEEPALQALEALYSPSTGIIDSHQLMLSLLADAESEGALISYGSTVSGIETCKSGGFIITVGDSGQTQTDAYRFRTGALVNAAGLQAQQLAALITNLPQATIPTLHLCKGSYFSLSTKNPFRHLIYPVPQANIEGLGIHLTRDMGGQCRFGPDVDYIDREDYQPSNPFDGNHSEANKSEQAALASRFYAAIRRYYPTLPDGALHADYAGIRPKLQAQGAPFADFQIQSEATHGLPGLIQLFGIESPGLTASLAIAERVTDLLADC